MRLSSSEDEHSKETTDMTKTITWKQVAAELKCGLYLSHDDYGRRVMRCNNGWVQARTPKHAMAFIKGIID
jgi:hypothetical protein